MEEQKTATDRSKFEPYYESLYKQIAISLGIVNEENANKHTDKELAEMIASIFAAEFFRQPFEQPEQINTFTIKPGATTQIHTGHTDCAQKIEKHIAMAMRKIIETARRRNSQVKEESMDKQASVQFGEHLEREHTESEFEGIGSPNELLNP